MENNEEYSANSEIPKFYKDAIDYWSTIPPTVDGMLGGFGFISDIDIQGSENFLKLLFKLKNPPGKHRALDCGAGIGRITKHLLIRYFDTVDLVEQSKTFVEESTAYIGHSTKIGNLYNVGLQDFKISFQYDVIWCQWVLSHLTDEDLVQFFQTCKKGLTRNGVIVVKENVASSETGEVDEVDSSITRSLTQMCNIFKQAGLTCIQEKTQTKMPKGLYLVKMFALRPNSR